jgi:lincosamide nucleotidyltransferase B/F
VLVQEEMIHKVGELCQADERLVAALTYGSFTQGEGDAFSDIEFWIFVHDKALAKLDEAAWVARVRPLEAYFASEFGTGVAIFDNLVRGEFHFEPASRMARLRDWPLGEEDFDPGAMILLDRTGELREHLEHLRHKASERLDKARLQEICNRYLNWLLLGSNVLERGERARALDALAHIHRHLLWLARVSEGQAGRHFLTPSRRLENDLSAASYRRYAATTAGVAAPELERAYAAAWAWGKELIGALSSAYGLDARASLLARLDEPFSKLEDT